MKLFTFLAIVPLCFSVACVSTKSDVGVSVYHLKDTKLIKRNNRMMRAEQQKHLRGVISLEEQQQRIGQYYTVDWDVRAHAVKQPIQIVFLYQQVGSGSKIHKAQQEFPASQLKGSHAFSVAGENYQTNGRVLTWRVEVRSGGALLVSEQSYLWE